MATATEERRTTSSARVGSFRAGTRQERVEAIEELDTLITSATAQLLDLVTAADAEGDWQADGATGAAPWLTALLHKRADSARAWVRTGAKLDTLPHLRAALEAGRLSFDQVKAAVAFVTPESDETDAELLVDCSVAQIEDLARQHRAIPKDRSKDAGERRFFRSRVDHRHGGHRFTGFLPDAEAARLNAVLDSTADRVGPNPETGLWDHIDQRRADALVDLADHCADTQKDPDASTVVVHAPASIIDGHVDGNGLIGDLPVPRDSILRLLCDTKLEFHLDTPDGVTVGIARAQRTIPRWLRRRILHRDGRCCRFPGCERRIRQIHHIQWWRNQGETNADNLIGLCWHHHRLVHEGGWTITGNPDQGSTTFTSPFGRKLRSKPQPLRPEPPGPAAAP